MKKSSFNWYIVGLVAFLGLLYLLSPILIPFFIAGLLAYLTNPLVSRLVALKVPRTLAVVSVFCILILCIVLLILLLFPLLQEEIVLFIDYVPQLITWLQDEVLPWLNKNFGIPQYFTTQSLKTMLAGHWQQAGSIVQAMLQAIIHSSHSVFTFLISLLLIPVVTFYLLRDWDDLLQSGRRLLPRNVEPFVVQLFNECNEVLGAFFRGQLLVMMSLGLFYSLGLWLVGLQFALLIGVVTGLISIVPYLGFIIGFLTAILVALFQFHEMQHVLYVAIVFGLGQMLESMLLTPWLIGDRIGLHPVVVIFAVLAGAQLFGFVGVLVALPVAAIIMVLLRHVRLRYIHSELYTKIE